MHDDPRRAAAEYDDMGRAYVDASTESPYNVLYERPAILELAGSVDGMRVLDVGCAAGALSAELLRRGATVTGVDASDRMVAAARARLGADATVHLADLASPLDFLEAASFDIVTASLVLQYLRDWAAPLREFHRVLVPDGRFVFTVHHPAARFNASPSGDYFATELLTDEWQNDGRTFEVHYYRRSLQSTLDPLFASGFMLERIVEPRPRDQMRAQARTTWAKLSTEPWFLGIAARKPVRP
jgi:SAM-dependent methyltransferase